MKRLQLHSVRVAVSPLPTAHQCFVGMSCLVGRSMVVLGHDTTCEPRWRRLSLAVERAPALYSYGWLTGSRVLLAPLTAISQGGTAATPPLKEHPSFNIGELCALTGQPERFPDDGEVTVYDTPTRKGVRGTLDMYPKNKKKPARVVLTGMGGTGKSHNLAYWVKHQRAAGHLVVYVNDMENWIEGGDQYIFREIEFAICNWRYWSDDVKSLGDLQSIGAKHPWLKAGNIDHQNKLTSWASHMSGLFENTMKMYTEDPGSCINMLRRVVDAAPLKEGAAVRPKCIFVVDQDNKLHRLFDGKRPSPLDTSLYTINQAMTTNKAHVTIASASANNEGWERRGWSDVVVQPAHGMEPCDADAMIRMILAPHKLYSEKVSEQVQDVTGCCPLDIKIICETAIGVSSPDDALRETWVGFIAAGESVPLSDVCEELREVCDACEKLWNDCNYGALGKKIHCIGQSGGDDVANREAVFELVRVHFVKVATDTWRNEQINDFLIYANSLTTEAQQRVSRCVLEDDDRDSNEVDRRFMEYRSRAPSLLRGTSDRQPIPGTQPIKWATFVYRNPSIRVTIDTWASGRIRKETFLSAAKRHEFSCIQALPFLLKGKNHSAVPIQHLRTVFPHYDVLMRNFMKNFKVDFAIYQCVPNAMYADAISIEYKYVKNGPTTCYVGVYQATINRKNHADSYNNMRAGGELQYFMRDLYKANAHKIEIVLCFFWMIDKREDSSLQDDYQLKIKGRTLKLKDVEYDATWHTKCNFLRDAGKLKRVVSDVKRPKYEFKRDNSKEFVSVKMDEYVFIHSDEQYTPPQRVEAST